MYYESCDILKCRDERDEPLAFDDRGPGVFACCLDAPEHVEEPIEPRLDLIANRTALSGQIQPSPNPADDSPHAGGRHHSRSVFHDLSPQRLLNSTRDACAPAIASPTPYREKPPRWRRRLRPEPSTSAPFHTRRHRW